jgi:hypothetical protein
MIDCELNSNRMFIRPDFETRNHLYKAFGNNVFLYGTAVLAVGFGAGKLGELSDHWPWMKAWWMGVPLFIALLAVGFVVAVILSGLWIASHFLIRGSARILSFVRKVCANLNNLRGEDH